MNAEQFNISTVRAFKAKKDWWKLFEGKRFIDVNEPEDGEFDILGVMYIPTTAHSVCKEDRYEIICFSKRLYICTASVIYFPSLKYVGKAKHKVVCAKN